MKKTLTAVAVLGTLAGSAVAADVTLYGIVDTGLVYAHVDPDFAASYDSFYMDSGIQSGSRFGLKGVEEIGNGLKVGFVLENGFYSDTGADKGVFFDREASLFVEGAFGKLGFGRMGSANSGLSSWSKVGVISAFGTSFTDLSAQAGNSFSLAGAWDNMISYETPKFAGLTFFAQYAMGQAAANHATGDDTAVENESTSDRYYIAGLTYANGPATAYFAVDSVNYRSFGAKNPMANATIDDSLTVTLGGNWDFEVAKVFFGAQYFDEVRLSSIGGLTNVAVGKDVISGANTKGNSLKLEGYSVSLSSAVPMLGGAFLAGASYIDADFADSLKNAGFADSSFKRYVVSAGYAYPFSKRTNIYAAATWMQDQLKNVPTYAPKVKPEAYAALVGLRHTF